MILFLIPSIVFAILMVILICQPFTLDAFDIFEDDGDDPENYPNETDA